MEFEEMKEKFCHRTMNDDRRKCIMFACMAFHEINHLSYECLDLRERDD